MPVYQPDRAGQPYRPSNGTEGMIFAGRWCDRCARDADPDNPCPIYTNALVFSVEDEDYPKEWVYDVDGNPKCKAFDDGSGEPAPYRCPDTQDMFGDKP